MKWTDGLKDQLTKLAFAEKSNKEIAKIMDIPLKEVWAGRSRFGITIAKVKAMKESEPTPRTQEIIKAEIKKVQQAKRNAQKKIKRCDDRLEELNKELAEITRG
ncbi:MAG TPA: hypothetical protein VFC96_04865 [Anaerovoracaceae bacterium]|nr:hypothetical protein [Anaerovoracaceae bacterium]